MTSGELTFLRDFFRAVIDRPLDPANEQDRDLYIPLYNNPQLLRDDPVDLMAKAIEWAPSESVQLFSGFRGTGKTPSSPTTSRGR